VYLLNPPIVQTPSGIAHVIERHTHNGIARYIRKSKFNAGENITELIDLAANQQIVLQPSGRYARTYDAGRVIGFDSTMGTMTTLVTVITDANGNLTTAFPGNP
jgi:hypothetical protein